MRTLTEAVLGVPVLDITYRRFETTAQSLARLEGAIEDDLAAFRAESVSSVVSTTFGNSIEMVD